MKFLSPFIVIIISIATYFMYISPSIAEISALSAQKSQYTEALANAQSLKTHRDLVMSQYNTISPTDIARLQIVMPDTTDNVGIVTNINAIASQYGMVVRGVKITQSQTENRSDPTTVPVVSTYSTTNINFTTDGSYQQFSMFLHDMEANAHLLDVTALTIKDVTTATGPELFEYTFTIQAYSLH